MVYHYCMACSALCTSKRVQGAASNDGGHQTRGVLVHRPLHSRRFYRLFLGFIVSLMGYLGYYANAFVYFVYFYLDLESSSM